MKAKDPFDALLHKYRGLLYTVCKRYSGGGAEFDDLLQEATLAVWRVRDRVFALPTEVQQAAVVWKVARNAAVDQVRHIKSHDPLPTNYDHPTDEHSMLDWLHEQIALLDEPDRTIVRLQLQGYSYKEIATQVDLSEKNVSVRLLRAKDRLKQMMNKSSNDQ